jgi:hypothetical protein
VLIHGGLAVTLVAGAALSVPARHRLVQLAATAGMIAAGVVYFVGDRWRTVDYSRPEARIAAVGAGAAWLLVLVGDQRRGDWRTAALVGCASTGLLLAAPNDWVVPALMFWGCSSVATALCLREAKPASMARFALLAGDVLIVSALIGAAQDAQLWLRPEGLEGWQLWVAAAGTILRAGALPLTGVWGSLDTRAAPALPLVVAGGFAMPLSSLDAQPWIAAGLLAGALWLAAWSLLRHDLSIGIVAAWPVALGLATAFAASRAEAAAGIQATLACAAVALWPATLGRAQVERGFLISFLPLTAGFAAVAVAASASFEAASRISVLSNFLPWAIVVGLLPLALLAGVLLGARAGAQAEPETFEPSAVLAVWVLLVVTVAIWIAAPQGVGQPRGGGLALQMGALVGAVAAAFMSRRVGPRTSQGADGVMTFRRPMLDPEPVVHRVVDTAAAGVGLVGSAAIVWFTVEGLRLGFL